MDLQEEKWRENFWFPSGFPTNLQKETFLEEGEEMKRLILFLVGIIIIVSTGNAFAKYSGGTGEPNDPYQISSKADLLAMASDTNDYSKCFILTADVNMEGQVFTTAVIASDTSGGSGFDGNAFKGTFDGNGYKVAQFSISNYSDGYLGLFGCIGNHGSIKNICVENFVVSGIYNVGSLVGYNDRGSITNCCSTGSVSGGIGALYVSGLVGYNNRGNIANCHSKSSVDGDSDARYVGGIAGYNYLGSIANCYSTGPINGGSNAMYVGGLIGYNNSSSIENSFSAAEVSGDLNTGGLVGYNSGTVSSSFWDTESSGQSSSAGGTGKTTAEMKALSTFTSAGWDFVEAWGIGNGQTYPYLKPFNGINPADLNYSGTVDFQDFAIFAENWLWKASWY